MLWSLNTQVKINMKPTDLINWHTQDTSESRFPTSHAFNWISFSSREPIITQISSVYPEISTNHQGFLFFHSLLIFQIHYFHTDLLQIRIVHLLWINLNNNNNISFFLFSRKQLLPLIRLIKLFVLNDYLTIYISLSI